MSLGIQILPLQRMASVFIRSLSSDLRVNSKGDSKQTLAPEYSAADIAIIQSKTKPTESVKPELELILSSKSTLVGVEYEGL